MLLSGYTTSRLRPPRATSKAAALAGISRRLAVLAVIVEWTRLLHATYALAHDTIPCRYNTITRPLFTPLYYVLRHLQPTGLPDSHLFVIGLYSNSATYYVLSWYVLLVRIQSCWRLLVVRALGGVQRATPVVITFFQYTSTGKIFLV